MLDEIALRRTDCEDSARRFGDNLFGNRAAKRARESIAVTRDDGDQIGVVFEGGARDFLCRVAVKQ